VTEKERKVISRTRTYKFALEPKQIAKSKIIGLTLGSDYEFYNSSFNNGLLFWKGIILKGTIDIPKSLRNSARAIPPEDIYTFRELMISGRRALFKKDIHYVAPSQVKYEITCKKIAKPKQEYHTSYVLQGLYNYNDFYEEELRTKTQRLVIAVEKPENMMVFVTTFGENVVINVLESSPTTYCVEICGKLVAGNGFSLHWQKVGVLQRVKSRVSSVERARIVACVALAFLLPFGTWVYGQNALVAISSYALALLALIYAFTPEHASEIIQSIKSILSARRVDNRKEAT
jgi:hypothetical protein